MESADITAKWSQAHLASIIFIGSGVLAWTAAKLVTTEGASLRKNKPCLGTFVVQEPRVE